MLSCIIYYSTIILRLSKLNFNSYFKSNSKETEYQIHNNNNNNNNADITSTLRIEKLFSIDVRYKKMKCDKSDSQ